MFCCEQELKDGKYEIFNSWYPCKPAAVVDVALILKDREGAYETMSWSSHAVTLVVSPRNDIQRI
jgi:hypothetical protein